MPAGLAVVGQDRVERAWKKRDLPATCQWQIPTLRQERGTA